LNRASYYPSRFDTQFSRHEENGYDNNRFYVDATVSGDFRVTEELSFHLPYSTGD
jgi:hypothetical protein